MTSGWTMRSGTWPLLCGPPPGPDPAGPPCVQKPVRSTPVQGPPTDWPRLRRAHLGTPCCSPRLKGERASERLPPCCTLPWEPRAGEAGRMLISPLRTAEPQLRRVNPFLMTRNTRPRHSEPPPTPPKRTPVHFLLLPRKVLTLFKQSRVFVLFMRGWVKETYGGVNTVTVVFNTRRPGRERRSGPSFNKADSGPTAPSFTTPGCDIGSLSRDRRPKPFIIRAFPLVKAAAGSKSRFISLPLCFYHRR